MSGFCRTCQHWNAHSIDMLKGDCMAPGDHRYWRVKLPDGSTALMDGFGRETTSPGHRCDAWKGDPMEQGPVKLEPPTDPRDARIAALTARIQRLEYALHEVNCIAIDWAGDRVKVRARVEEMKEHAK